MKRLLILVSLVTILLSNPAQAHELKPGWRHIPGGVRKCVYDPDLQRNVCSIHCNQGYRVSGHSCVAVR